MKSTCYTRYCRSILFVPAPAVGRYAQAQASGADISLVDLEDSVAPRDKEAAREQVRAFFSAPRIGPGPRAVRINAVTEPDGLRDLLALRLHADRPDVVMIPKVESPRDVEIVERVLGPDFAGVHLFAVVETARGLENVSAIAAASPRLKALVFGSADFSFNIGASMSWGALAYARARLITAARAAGLDVVDTARFDIDAGDEELRAEAELARDLGFSGKAAVHPRQVRIINQVFSPDEATLERARRIVAASAASGGGICVVDGIAAGHPFIAAARQLLADFDGRREP